MTPTRVLLLGGEPERSLDLASRLESRGFFVTHARRLDGIRSAARGKAFDVVVFQHEGPILDDEPVLTQLKACDPEVQIILLGGPCARYGVRSLGTQLPDLLGDPAEFQRLMAMIVESSITRSMIRELRPRGRWRVIR